jgi:hypothetical protein
MNAHKQCYKVIKSDCMPDKKYVRRGLYTSIYTLGHVLEITHNTNVDENNSFVEWISYEWEMYGTVRHLFTARTRYDIL